MAKIIYYVVAKLAFFQRHLKAFLGYVVLKNYLILLFFYFMFYLRTVKHI